jgi:PAS domain S-box-containing protein
MLEGILVINCYNLSDATQSKSIRISVSKDGSILNAINCQLVGYNAASIVGGNISMFVPEPWKSQHDAMMKMYEQTQVSTIVGRVRNVPLQCADGSIVPVTLRVTIGDVNQVPMYTALVDLVDPRLVLMLTLTKAGIIER